MHLKIGGNEGGVRKRRRKLRDRNGNLVAKGPSNVSMLRLLPAVFSYIDLLVWRGLCRSGTSGTEGLVEACVCKKTDAKDSRERWFEARQMF